MLASTRLRLRSARHGASRKSENGSNVGSSGRIHVRHAHNKRVLGIRREDPQRIWERRCPLTPEAVERLVNEHNVEVLVQPCDRRIFKTEDFVKVSIETNTTNVLCLTDALLLITRLEQRSTRHFLQRMFSLVSRKLRLRKYLRTPHLPLAHPGPILCFHTHIRVRHTTHPFYQSSLRKI